MTRRLSPPPDIIHRWIKLCPFPEPADQREARRRAWVAAALRGAYGTGWLPPSVAVRIIRVEPREDAQAVVITLRGGTRIIDRAERIEIVGVVDDVVVDELVAAVVRRGWDAVEVHGSPEFRKAVSLRLGLLDPPVAVADSPLTEIEETALERARLARDAGREMKRSSPVHVTAGGMGLR